MTDNHYCIERLPPVLSAGAMREADRKTIEEMSIPCFTLMESAGREGVRIAKELLEGQSGGKVVVLCGKGNNGGDGIVMARYLAQADFRVTLVLCTKEAECTIDAQRNLGILHFQNTEKLASLVEIVVCGADAGHGASEKLPSDAALIVDALLGTGLESDVRTPVKELINWANTTNSPVLSIDIASGLSSDSGTILGVAVRADVTLTLGTYQAGHLLNSGPEQSGRICVADIGFPPRILARAARNAGCAFLSSDEYVRDRLVPRSRKDHKYTSGPSIIAGGSKSFPGAPALAARGAARAGSGYVICLCPESIRNILIEKLDEIPVEAWAEAAESNRSDDSGSSSPDEHTVTGSLIERLGSRWKKAKALLVGPGLGRDESAIHVTRELLTQFEGGAVVDADALFALKDDPEWVAEHSDGKWVFTPHEGEFRRFSDPKGESTATPSINRIEQATRFARRWNVVVLLKGMPSITAAPDGRAVVNQTGNPSVGTAGSGDVLAGIVTGLLAQGLSSFDAAVCGVHLAGTAADTYVEDQASQSLVASDILDALPSAMAHLSRT